MLYTGKGDGGTTKLLTTPKGVRVSKSSAVFDALGTLDELNTVLGMCRSYPSLKDAKLNAVDKSINEVVLTVQQHLFIIQTEVAGNKEKSIDAEKVSWLETLVNTIEETLPPITTFFLPGETFEGSLFDMARAVSRRAERTLLKALHAGEAEVSDETKAYINRLSSLLYALVRSVNQAHNVPEIKPTYT